MGNLVNKLFRPLWGQKEVRILSLGLDAAGKTTLLYKMKLGEITTVIPTIGMNVEQVDYKNLNLTAFDVGGRGGIRPLWRHYAQNVSGIIFCVDSNDRDRIYEAEGELKRILAWHDDAAPQPALLIFANKQDLPNAMSIAEIADKLSLHQIKGRPWRILLSHSDVESSCFTSGDGIYEGIDWLSKTIADSTLGEVQRKVENTPSTIGSLFSKLVGSSTKAVEKVEAATNSQHQA